MPLKIAPRPVTSLRFLILGGECFYPVRLTAGAGTTEVDIDAEIQGQPVVRTGPISGAMLGQGAGPRLTYAINDGVIAFNGGGGGPNAVDFIAIISFPADEVTP